MSADIFCLQEYNWERGILISTGKKNYKIHFRGGAFMLPHDRYVPKEKCALPGESICVVWETWKGTNGRGAYRVERELYPACRVPAEQVSYQHGGVGRVTEVQYGVER